MYHSVYFTLPELRSDKKMSGCFIQIYKTPVQNSLWTQPGFRESQWSLG